MGLNFIKSFFGLFSDTLATNKQVRENMLMGKTWVDNKTDIQPYLIAGVFVFFVIIVLIVKVK